MKKTFSLALVLALLFSLLGLPVNAANLYPESSHNYKNNTTDVQTYTCPGSPDGMYVTFSASTFTEESDVTTTIMGELTEEMLTEFAQKGYFNKPGDTIRIEYGSGFLYGEFQGSQLSGKTIYIPSDTMTITLISDAAVTGYGYKITRISTTLPANQAMVIYDVNGDKYPVNYTAGDSLELHYNFQNKIIGNKAIIGWQTADGKQLWYRNYENDDEGFDYPSPDYTAYKNGEITYAEYRAQWDAYDKAYNEWAYGVDLKLEGGKTYVLTPIYCNVSIRSDEVYSFTNSSRYFCNQVDGYYFTDDDFYQQYLNYGMTFALSPLAPVGAIACTVLTAVWPTIEWSGSCCGFPLTVLLQHNGKIDMLSGQGVDCVRDLVPDETVISRINFYNSQAVAGFPTDNMGLKRGTKDYTRQLKKLFKTVESGKPVYLEYYSNDGHILLNILHLDFDMISMAHGVLLTGAYTDADGNHVILGYNNNSSNYYKGYTDVYTINKDFTDIYDNYGSLLDGFSWNADISYLDSFPIKGIPNPFAWHIEFLKNIFTNLIEILREFFGIVK